MKVGDLVRILGSFGLPPQVGNDSPLVGTLISPWKVDKWWEVLLGSGRVIHWPESQMEMISEDR